MHITYVRRDSVSSDTIRQGAYTQGWYVVDNEGFYHGPHTNHNGAVAEAKILYPEQWTDAANS